MLALTKKTSYALIAMAHLAKLGESELASSRELSEQFGMPISLVMNVLKELAAAGYVESVRGVHGGYRLARRPEEVNLADLIAAIESSPKTALNTQCLTHDISDGHECTLELMARCPIADPVHRVHRRLNDFLKKVTLAEIVDQPANATAK